jgi:glutamate dehydrogenase/leucine dehydrogenase
MTISDAHLGHELPYTLGEPGVDPGNPANDWGEQLVFCSSEETGLRAIIAIDSTVLGPAMGGTRIRAYASTADAVRDVRLLASAMTVKAALAGLPVGGGKAVIIADPARDKSEALLRAYGRFVHTLGGRYIAAQDVGTSPADLDVVATETPYVTGLTESRGGGGNPSPFTARGVFQATTAAALHRNGTAELTDVHVVVLGVGSVGGALVDLLVEAGARVTIADAAEDRLEAVQTQHDVQRVPWETAHATPCDVFAPCALGGVLNPQTIPELDCWAVVGAANNQLAESRGAEELTQRGILYVPDFLASAGGPSTGTTEKLWPPFRRESAMAAIDAIHDRTLMVLRRADADGRSTVETGFSLARERIDAVRQAPSLTTLDHLLHAR